MMMTEKEMRAQRAAAARRREMKRKRVMRNRMILAGVIFALALIIAGVTMVIHTNKANAAAEEYEYIPTHNGTFVEFTHVVKGGESVGTIAAKYIQQYGSDETVDDVVDRIINYSGLDRKEATYHLQPGDQLIVPLWIAEDRNPHHSGTVTCTEESQN
mgnify:FL=1|jgi:hypothetical protein